MKAVLSALNNVIKATEVVANGAIGEVANGM
jgi:hypothetical protein